MGVSIDADNVGDGLVRMWFIREVEQAPRRMAKNCGVVDALCDGVVAEDDNTGGAARGGEGGGEGGDRVGVWGVDGEDFVESVCVVVTSFSKN